LKPVRIHERANASATGPLEMAGGRLSLDMLTRPVSKQHGVMVGLGRAKI